MVLPALDEEHSIGLVLDALPRAGVAAIVVADNGSADATAAVASQRGATVVFEPRRGYGRACLTALAEVARQGPSADDAVVFLDADFSDDPAELPQVVGPVIRGEADLVVGSRTRGGADRGALLPQARFGNWLATRMLRAMTGVAFTDLGPFRAIRWSVLGHLRMTDPAFGWTVEMQLKAAAAGWRCVEVPVRYRKRVGRSKISGTVRGSVRAGVAILRVLLRHAFASRPRGRVPGPPAPTRGN